MNLFIIGILFFLLFIPWYFLAKKITFTTLIGKIIFMLLLTVFFVSTYVLYARLGAYSDVVQAELIQNHEKEIKALLANIHSVDDVIEKLKKHLSTEPNSATGWYLLGRLYQDSNRFNDAEAAFAKAHQLKPHDLKIMSQYAQAIYFNQEKITPFSQTLIDEVLTIDPSNHAIRYLNGLVAFNHKHYDAAIALWEPLKENLSENSSEKILVQTMLNKAYALKSPSANISIKVFVAIKPSLTKFTSQNDTVFIFAKAPNTPMPIAVIRKTVKDLPCVITFDDHSILLPNVHLSDYKQISIGSRISKTGDAMPKSGDLESPQLLINFLPKMETIKLLINQRHQ